MTSLTDSTSETFILCRADRADLFHLRYTLEAYEGLCVTTTLPGGGGVVRLSTSREQKETLLRVLQGIQQEVALEILGEEDGPC